MDKNWENWIFVSIVCFGKQCRVKFNVDVHRTKGILDYIHSDL